jgi:ribosome biogenesis GTPase A
MRKRYSFSSRRTGRIGNIKKQRQKYPNLAEKIVEISDIVLELLDARFFQETRNLGVEELVKKRGKKIIYVVNKVDLIDNLKKQEIKQSLKPVVLVSCKERKGVAELRDFIKLIAKRVERKENKIFKKSKVVKEESDKVKVGIIGYPNTGKSSLLNLLIGRASLGVGSEAGFTKGIQKIKLSKDIVLLDSPGVIPKEHYSNSEVLKIANQTIFGGRSYNQIKEPDIAVQNLMLKFPNVLERTYKIEANGDSEILLNELGKRKGFLKKGGFVNEDQTARFVIKDWQEGKIEI